jgi:hypothetical protein
VHYHIISLCAYAHNLTTDRGDKLKMGYRQRGYYNQWPGRGPFSHLPPWQRPGRGFGGRGARRCIRFPWLPSGWWTDPNYAYQLSIPSPQEEMAALEDCKNSLGKEKASIEQEINDIEKHLKELKSKLDSEKNQQPTSQ